MLWIKKDQAMKKILVVEDNENNLYMMKFLLNKSGYDVAVAKTGLEGIELSETEKPSLILMDIQLPDIDGYEVTRRIRMKEAADPPPIVAVTSYAMTGDREKSLKAGCTGYIEKPIDPATFISEIEKYI